MATKDSRGDGGTCLPRTNSIESLDLWYRHTGQPEVDGIPRSSITKTLSCVDDITRDIGSHYITHLHIKNGAAIDLEEVAPQLTELKVSGLDNISHLECLSSLSHLVSLDLSNNSLSVLPPVILGLTGLVELRLDSCSLTSLPDGLSSLTKLRKLHLSSNDFSSPFPAVIEKLTGLEELHLDGCRLTCLPDSLSSLTKLKWLYLGNNNFSAKFPDVLSKLTSLDELYIYRCGLKSLPSSLANCTRLKRLWLNDNDFSGGLPLVVSEMDWLEELYLDSCQLTSLPSLTELSQLCRLSLNRNNFASTADLSGGSHPLQPLAELSSLEELYLSNCKLTVLPDGLSCLSQLADLSLSFNNFSTGLPEVVTTLSSLQELNLSNSRLTSLPNSLSSLIHLKSLQLSCNLFGCLPEAITELTSLEKLFLIDCKLESLPRGFANLKQLKQLWLTGNSFFASLPDVLGELTSLEELRLNRCGLSGFPGSLFELKNLRSLSLSYNNFSEGLPSLIVNLTSLISLELESCRLRTLPKKFGEITTLETLNLSRNNFRSLPAVVSDLKNLRTLDLTHNYFLKRLDIRFLELENLKELRCRHSSSLVHPPYAVCLRGISAVKRYWIDISGSKSVYQSDIPVAVVGNSYSGKTSIIRSLQKGKRMLTNRMKGSSNDQTTRLFQIASLQLRNCKLRFIDYGGHDEYHVAYPLLLGVHSLLVLVVNMYEFSQIVQAHNPKEAARRVFFDWMSHIYVACPKLGRPVLVLTHKDKFSATREWDSCKEELLSLAESIRKEILDEDKVYAGNSPDELSLIKVFSDLSTPLIDPAKIFEFSDDLDETSNIKKLRATLDGKWEKLSIAIPETWESLCRHMENQLEKPLIPISELESLYSTDLANKLRHFHNCGRILWFEEEKTLSPFVFHQISAVVDTITRVFSHYSSTLWRQRQENFRAFSYKEKVIGKQEYMSLVDKFTSTGQLDEVLLMSLFRDSILPYHIAVDILSSQFLLFKPIPDPYMQIYIVPSLATGYMDDEWQTDGKIQLRMNIQFSGLSPPKYVHHLLTGAALQATVKADSTTVVRKNGATIRNGSTAVHVLHNYNSKCVTLQVSTDVSQLDRSWKLLLELVKTFKQFLRKVWKGCHEEFLFYCAHCLLRRIPAPDYFVDPDWLAQSPLDYMEDLRFCKKGTETKPTVPWPLHSPCLSLTQAQMKWVQTYIDSIAIDNSSFVRGVRNSSITPATHALEEVDEDSDLSDVEEERYCDDSELADAQLNMLLRPVRKESNKSLYFNTDKVYQMASGSRGRALIINLQASSRHNDSIDTDNLRYLFTRMRFDVVCHSNLSAEELYREVTEETRNDAHVSASMFVLILLGEGGQGGVVYDCNRAPIDMLQVLDLISSKRFLNMRYKPKMVMVVTGLAEGEETSSFTRAEHEWTSDRSVYKTLNVDDFLIIRALNNHPSPESPTHGTWFIRVLLATFYRHANHRDVVSLLKIVEKRMRQVNSKFKGEGDSVSRSSLNYLCAFTNSRKLYLFPGFPTITSLPDF